MNLPLLEFNAPNFMGLSREEALTAYEIWEDRLNTVLDTCSHEDWFLWVNLDDRIWQHYCDKYGTDFS